MPIRVECPQCGKEHNVGDDKAGRRFQCKGCQATVVVPDAAIADPDDPFAGLGDDFMSKPARPTSGNASSKGGNTKTPTQEAGGNGVAIGVGIGLGVFAVVAGIVFFLVRGGDQADDRDVAGGARGERNAGNDDDAPVADAAQSLIPSTEHAPFEPPTNPPPAPLHVAYRTEDCFR